MAFSDYLENKLAAHSIGLAQYTMPTQVYLALFTADPTDVGDLTNELNVPGYTRISVNGKLTVQNGQIVNTDALVFPEATTDWGTITHMALVDDSVGGNVLYHGPITPKTINTGDIFAILAYDFRISLD